MRIAKPTLARFFLADTSDPLARAEAGRPIEALRRDLAAQAPSLAWPDVRETLREKIEEALDISFGEILVHAWVRSLALARYLDSSKYPSDRTVVTPLSKHTVRTTLSPCIAVFLGERQLPSIPMDVTLSLHLKGGIVTIRGGKILELHTGSGEASGKVSVAGVPIATKELEPIEFPGEFTFKEGRQLRPSERAT